MRLVVIHVLVFLITTHGTDFGDGNVQMTTLFGFTFKRRTVMSGRGTGSSLPLLRCYCFVYRINAHVLLRRRHIDYESTTQVCLSLCSLTAALSSRLSLKRSSD